MCMCMCVCVCTSRGLLSSQVVPLPEPVLQGSFTQLHLDVEHQVELALHKGTVRTLEATSPAPVWTVIKYRFKPET